MGSLVDVLLGQVVQDPADVRARLAGHLLVAGATHVVAMWLRGELDLDEAAFVEHLVALGVDAVRDLGLREG